MSNVNPEILQSNIEKALIDSGVASDVVARLSAHMATEPVMVLRYAMRTEKHYADGRVVVEGLRETTLRADLVQAINNGDADRRTREYRQLVQAVKDLDRLA